MNIFEFARNLFGRSNSSSSGQRANGSTPLELNAWDVRRPSSDPYFEAMVSQRPTGRANAEASIGAVYAELAEKSPQIIWAPSPLSGLKLAILAAWSIASADAHNQELLVKLENSRQSSHRGVDVSFSTRIVSDNLRPYTSYIQSTPSLQLVTSTITQSRNETLTDLHRQPPLDTFFEQWQQLKQFCAESSAVELHELSAASDLLWLLDKDEQRGALTELTNALSRVSKTYFDNGAILLNYAHLDTMSNPTTPPGAEDSLDYKLRWHAAQTAMECDVWWAFPNLVVAVERAEEVYIDASLALHAVGRKAIRYADGFGVYAVKGLPISEHIAMKNFSAADIDAEKNVELRRCMVEVYGAANYLRETGSKLIHRDSSGSLYSKSIAGDDPIVIVEVVNKTAEPDGTFKKYFLRVPPETRTARQGVAWTFGLTEKEYAPEHET